MFRRSYTWVPALLLSLGLVACAPNAPQEVRLLDAITTQLPGDFNEVGAHQLSAANYGFFGREVDYSPDQNHDFIVRAAIYEVAFRRKDLPRWLATTHADLQQNSTHIATTTRDVRVINDTPWAIIAYQLETENGPVQHRHYATSYSGQLLLLMIMVNPDGADRYDEIVQLTDTHLTVE